MDNSIKMDKVYNPQDFEERIYESWIQNDCFKPQGDSDKEPFVIVIPPPNVTGVLHMGHGLNNSLQDILVRYYRMKGRPTLWVPGTDHAGIATQHVVEKKLREQNLDRKTMGREAFLQETWKVKEQHHQIITRQLKKIGSSCDWSHERFTLDEGLSEAVKEVFVRLYQKNLIYRGSYLVNWCSSCGTALADDEVEHEECQGALYHYRYPFADGSGFIEIATTRPETMFGDTAVAVHPDDERYKKWVGKELVLPLSGRTIPLIADEYVDREFGSGAVKITPAHDINDWEVGKRHHLPQICCIDDQGKMNDAAAPFVRGLSIKEARKVTIEKLKEEGFFLYEEPRVHQVGHCYRCHCVIEPTVSTQWFVRMKPLAEKALKAWEEGKIRFYPKKWENTYKHWLENIRDWCISRQLWWGHRIPVWYCDECNHMHVSQKEVSVCSHCGSSSLHQDEDVLDTWFSSWLWPFSTLGWPNETPDLKKFFPTSTLVTAYDIIFFWVSRMIMASLEFTGEVPFRDIFIHQLVRDKQGRKMSKSLGNGIDPLDIVKQYGADSLKFTLAYMAAQGQDILIDSESFKLGSKFSNKVWNASRYILMNLESTPDSIESVEKSEIDRWIYHQLNQTLLQVDQAIGAYKFNDAAHLVYDFFWNDFCDWYIEASKLDLYSKEPQRKKKAQVLLCDLLKKSLRMLHPFIPFITEEIWSKIPGAEGFLMNLSYPEYQETQLAQESANAFSQLQQLIRGVRTLRSEFTIPPEKSIRVSVLMDIDFAYSNYFMDHQALISSLLNATVDFIEGDSFDSEGSVTIANAGFETFVFVREAVDIERERAKLIKEREQLTKLEKSTQSKLKNPEFLSRAPQEVIEKEKSKWIEFTDRISKIESYLKRL